MFHLHLYINFERENRSRLNTSPDTFVSRQECPFHYLSSSAATFSPAARSSAISNCLGSVFVSIRSFCAAENFPLMSPFSSLRSFYFQSCWQSATETFHRGLMTLWWGLHVFCRPPNRISLVWSWSSAADKLWRVYKHLKWEKTECAVSWDYCRRNPSSAISAPFKKGKTDPETFKPCNQDSWHHLSLYGWFIFVTLIWPNGGSAEGYHTMRDFLYSFCGALIRLSQTPTLCFILLIADLQLFFFFQKLREKSPERQAGQAAQRSHTGATVAFFFFFSQ